MMVDDVKKMKSKVDFIMKEFPNTRNSDTILIFKVLEDLGFVKNLDNGYFIEKKDLYNVPCFESITRVRRKIQNDEERLLPTDKRVLRQRRMLKEEMDEIHEWYDDGW